MQKKQVEKKAEQFDKERCRQITERQNKCNENTERDKRKTKVQLKK